MALVCSAAGERVTEDRFRSQKETHCPPLWGAPKPWQCHPQVPLSSNLWSNKSRFPLKEGVLSTGPCGSHQQAGKQGGKSLTPISSFKVTPKWWQIWQLKSLFIKYLWFMCMKVIWYILEYFFASHFWKFKNFNW